MNFRNLISPILAIIFPHQPKRARTPLVEALITHTHIPAPAVYDPILRFLNGSARFAYRDPYIRAAIHALKYDGTTDIALWFAQQSEHVIQQLIAGTREKPIIVVPIPVTLSRHLGRGYNQSALIAKAIVTLFPQSLILDETMLVRNTFAQSQTKARTRRERAKNIRDAFEVSASENVRNRHVLIIDDVITTGATIREAARVLRAAGARDVSCFAIAH